MATITFRFPTDEEEDLQLRFTVTKNSLAGFLRQTNGGREKL